MGVTKRLANSLLPAGPPNTRARGGGLGPRGALVGQPPITGSGSSGRSNQWDLFSKDREKINLQNATDKGYYASEWVMACVNAIAGPASTVPWRVSTFKQKSVSDTKEKRERRRLSFYRELESVPPSERAEFMRQVAHTKAHELEPVPDHPLERLMEKPNGLYTRQWMIEILAKQLLLSGNGLLHLNRGSNDGGRSYANGPPLEMYPVDPDLVTPVPDVRSLISRYDYRASGDAKEPQPIKPRDMLHLMLPDPKKVFWGQSWLRAAARVVDTDVEAVKFNKFYLGNMATPSGVLSYKEKLSREQWEEARQRLQEEYQGTMNAGRPMVDGNGLTYTPMGISPREMSFIESRGMNRTSIAAVFGVDPDAVWGQSQSGAGKKETKMWHWLDTVIPFVDRFASLFNLRLAPEFGEDYVIWYDTSGIEALRPVHHEKVQSAKTVWSMGVPFKEVNRRYMLGFSEDIPGTEVGYLPASGLAVAGENGEPLGDGTGGVGNTNTNPDGGTNVEDGDGNSQNTGPSGSGA